MKSFIIGLIIFASGAISCSFYYSFINPNRAYVMLVDMEQCGIQKVKIEIDNKNIYADKWPGASEIEVMFYTRSYPYTYNLTAYTKKCGNITSDTREINDGRVFYERVYKDRIEHEIRA